MSNPDFSSDEVAILAEHGIPLEEQATEEATAQAAPAATTASEPAQQTAAPQETTAQQQPTEAAPPKPGGDVRAALRASRRAEQRAREEAARLREEVEQLKSKVTTTTEPDPMSDEEIERAERDFPLLGKTARYVKQAMTAQPAQATASQPTSPESDFVPPALPAPVQEIVDNTPDLLAWQYDPDQARFELAKSMDALLQKHPAWASKPLAERLSEVVRRVNAELPAQAAQSAPASTVDPRAALAAVPRRAPETLTHIGGGGGKQPEPPALTRYMSMSDDQIVADLLRGVG